MQLEIRPFTASDIEFALMQTAREGWGATRALFETCLAHDPEGCFIAEEDGGRVGMITTTRYAQTGWVGNLVVVPERRRQGLGRQLMSHVIARLTDRGVRAICLEADPMGIRLYRRLGFVDQFESRRFRREPPHQAKPSSADRLGARDLPTIAGFDTAAFGDDRSRLLAVLFGKAKAAYWIRDNPGPRGYAFVLPTASGVSIGPWVAVDRQAADNLLRRILAEFAHHPLVIGVPNINRAAAELFESQGFQQTAPSLRMFRGEPGSAGNPTRIFGIANGAMG